MSIIYNQFSINSPRVNRLILTVCAIALFSALFLQSVNGQQKRPAPEMQVNGITLNDETSGRNFLSKYSARRGADDKPTYYFYNEYGTEVMKITAFSEARPYLVTKIEVYAVGKSYQEKHFYLRGQTSFVTESGLFIGLRQSATSLIFAVANRVGEKEIIRKKGQPDDLKKEDKRQILTYNFDGSAFKQSASDMRITDYTAVYETSKNGLRRFSIAVELEPKR